MPEHTIVHCFTGGPEEARRCLDLGASLSFSGVVTFKNAADVRDAAALCPMDRLLVETDSPFLTPVPHRGTPNEPARVPLVGAAVAHVKGVTEPRWPRSPRPTPGGPSASDPTSDRPVAPGTPGRRPAPGRQPAVTTVTSCGNGAGRPTRGGSPDTLSSDFLADSAW